MTSITYAVRWTEATGNGDIFHEQLFDSQDQAQAWLDEHEGNDPMGYPSVFFDHCGPRTIEPA